MTATAPTTTTSPTPGLPSTTHRRIDLQSPLDLSYLLNNARSAARAKIDLHLPLAAAQAGVAPNAQGSDEMRQAVERSVDAYIERTFEMVRTSVDVNGIEGEKVDWTGLGGPEEYEPYSAPLAHRITSLHGEIEALNLSLANTRREAVARASQQYQDSFARRSAEDDAALDAYASSATEAGKGVVGEEKLGFEGREEEVRRVWEGACEGLRRLEGQQGLRALRERVEGAEKVVGYLEGR